MCNLYDHAADDALDNEEERIQEEYRVWKKNSTLLYDVVVTHSLEWPSLTVEWLPDYDDNGKFSEQRLILGTHTADGEPNYLMLATIRLPLDDAEASGGGKDDDGSGDGSGGPCGKVDILMQIPHTGEVNRARHMPQSSNFIATKSPTADVLVFDYQKHPNRPREGEPVACSPELRLVGHTMEGYGLDWNPVTTGRIASGGDDMRICVWDVPPGGPMHGRSVQPLMTLSSHTAVVEDVAWHRRHADVLASAGDDRRLLIWDTRDSSGKPRGDYVAHEDSINCLSFNPFQEFLLASGSSDNTVALWDTRNMKTKVHSFVNHDAEVFQVQWSPTNESILASSGSDRRVNVWDMSRIGAQQSPEDAEDGPPELLFIHGGHCAKVSDFSWSANVDWMIASVAEDNALQIWEMAEHIYEDADGESAPADGDLE